MKIKVYGLGTLIPFVLCVFATAFVGFSNVPNRGLSCLFLLPLTFSITILLFSKEYAYRKESFGLTILYLSAIVRYIVTPVLIVLSQATVTTISAGEWDYAYAIFVEIFELIVVMFAVKYIWPKHLRAKEKIKLKSKYDPEKTTFRLTWTGFAFAMMLVALIVLRGHWNNIVSHLSTWFRRVDNREVVYNYDMMAFNIVKTVAFLIVVSAMKWIYNRTTLKTLPVMIALAAGLLNTMFFEFRERTDLAVLAIASFFVLSHAFPRSKKLFKTIFGVGGVVAVAVVFLEGTFQYEVGTSVSTIAVSNYAKLAELYTTGPTILANAHKNFASVRSQVNFMTYAKDLVLSCDLFGTVPFLRFIYNAVSAGKGTVELYVASIGGRAYIIPNHSLAALYVGDVLCWILEPIFIILNIKLLGWFERCMYRINDLLQVYAIFSIVTMVAMGIFCNNFQLMLHSFSSLPLWLLIFSYINNLGNKIKILKSHY